METMHNEAEKEKLAASFKLSKDASAEALMSAADESDIETRKPTDAEFSEFLEGVTIPEKEPKESEEELIKSLNHEELDEKFLGFTKDEDGKYWANFTKPSIRNPYALSKEHTEMRINEFKRQFKQEVEKHGNTELTDLELKRAKKMLDNWPED